MSVTYPGESAEYRAARNRLLEQEIELRRQTEAVAAARRALPPGGEIREDYVFEERGADGGPTGTLELLWNLLDLTPKGRPTDWHEQLSYGGSAP